MKEALEHINKYAYRKEFGLSAEEYADEPVEDLQINQFIMKIIAEKQEEELKTVKRQQDNS